jgi:hypothetical protein
MAVRTVGAWYEIAPACEDVSPGAEELPVLENVTKQHGEDRDWDGSAIVIWKV